MTLVAAAWPAIVGLSIGVLHVGLSRFWTRRERVLCPECAQRRT